MNKATVFTSIACLLALGLMEGCATPGAGHDETQTPIDESLYTQTNLRLSSAVI